MGDAFDLGTASPSDFTDETLKGTCSFSGSGTTVITRTWANDRATEGSETWVMEVSYENGKVESGEVTIYDSSVAPTATIARTSATINEEVGHLHDQTCRGTERLFDGLLVDAQHQPGNEPDGR